MHLKLYTERTYYDHFQPDVPWVMQSYFLVNKTTPNPILSSYFFIRIILKRYGWSGSDNSPDTSNTIRKLIPMLYTVYHMCIQIPYVFNTFQYKITIYNPVIVFTVQYNNGNVQSFIHFIHIVPFIYLFAPTLLHRCIRLWPLAPVNSPLKIYFELALQTHTNLKFRSLAFSPCGRIVAVT